MIKLSVLLGLFLILLPILVMAGEVLYARATGATGERLMAAGFWGVAVGYVMVAPGFVLLILGLLGALFGRE